MHGHLHCTQRIDKGAQTAPRDSACPANGFRQAQLGNNLPCVRRRRDVHHSAINGSNKAGAAWQQPAMCAWHWAGHTFPCSRSNNGNVSRVMRLRTITKCHRWEGQMALLVAALSQSAQHLLQCSLSDGANPISMELQNASRHCGVSMCWIVLQRKPPTAGLVTPHGS